MMPKVLFLALSSFLPVMKMALANVEAQDTVQFTQPEALETFHQLTEDDQTIFGADFCEQTCGFDDTEIEIEEADDLLYSFVERLKTYVTPFAFKFTRFDADCDTLFDEFMTIQEIVSTLKSEIVSSQLSFAKQMVDSMAKAVERLRSYYDPESAADGVLCKISEIGVSAFALHNSYGFLDMTIPDHIERVTWLWHELALWKLVFKDLKTVTVDDILAFEENSANAESLVRKLLAQLRTIDD